MRVTTYNVTDRRVIWDSGATITGNENVDKFHFVFDSEWDSFSGKFLVLIVNGTSYIDQLDAENNVILRDIVYDQENVEFGVFGIQTGQESARLSTDIVAIETIPSIWGRIRDVSDLPDKTQWEIYTEEMLALLAEGQITLEACQQALTDALSAKDTTEGYKNTTKGYMETTEGYKDTTKGYMDTTEGYKRDTAGLKQDTINIVTEFNSNVEQKTTDFNNNASSKTTAFNNNVSSKTSDFNSNYTDKLGTFNSNATSKTTDFNDNASSKTTTFNNNATSKTNTFNSNATDKTTAFDNNANSKTGDFNDNATAKTTAFNENYQAKLDDFNENAASYNARITDLELLKSNLNVESLKGTYLNIIDSLNAKIEDFVLCGMASQDTYTGKNLLQGLELGDINSSTGAETSSTNAIRSINKINYDTTKTYYSSVNGTLLTSAINLRFYNQSDEYIGYASLTGSGSNFNINKQTAVEDDTPVYFRFRVSTIYVPTVDEKLMISTSDNLTYEPYTGGQPSPSPDYPQNISVVTGDNTVNLTKKNLWGGKTFTTSQYQVDFTINNNGTVTASGTASSNAVSGNIQKYVNEGMFIDLEAGTYTISKTSAKIQLQVYDTMSNSIKTLTTAQNTGTFTLTEKTSIIVRIMVPSGTTVNETFLFQLEKGSTATTYEPYTSQTQLLSLGSMELATVGNYQDKLFHAVNGCSVYDSLDSTTKASLTYGSWYKQGNVRKYTSCVSAHIVGSTQNGRRFLLKARSDLHDMISTTNKGTFYLSSSFLQPQNQSSLIGLQSIYNYGWGGLAIYTTNSDLINLIGANKTEEELKDWFDNNVTMYVVIVPDYDYTEITDATLIEQLNAIEQFQTYRNITNAFVTTSNEVPEIEISYLKDDRVGYESQLASLDARVTLLEG